MSNTQTKIRYGEEADLHRIVDIMNYYVDNHHSTFYLEHITIENRREWFEKFSETGLYRLIVAEQNALPNERSIEIHKKFEFEEVGVFNEYAYVKDQYFSSIWMQKRL